MTKLFLFIALASGLLSAQATPRLFEITADHDSRFKVAGRPSPTLTLKSGERVILRITAIKAKSMNRDGAIHGFVLLDKNGEKVPGWMLSLQPGTHDFALTAPAAPGDYKVLCNVICSQDHETMHMTIKVLPTQSALETSR
jgi:heme/copper-type cytochrome/quinol oxidase subunit 2